MSMLHLYDEQGRRLQRLDDASAIAAELATVGVRFERWQAGQPLAVGASEAAVLAAYRPQVAELQTQYGCESVDVVAMYPDHPEAEALRRRFLDEHTHDDFEIRFFVEGRGVFYLRPEDGRIRAVLCTQGDLISVPANMRHWFDMGTAPDFRCIRFFTKADGWVARFTGSDIARRLPDFDALAAEAA